jgi:uncharacterized protein YndB with AHSA1/START domain
MDIFNTYDWTKFVCRININANMEQIYDAWTKPALLEKWFLCKARFIPKDEERREPDEHIRKNDTYHWRWFGFSKDVSEKGIVMEANGTDLLQFTFSGDTLVTVILKTEEAENIVELWQENIPKTEVAKVDYHLYCMMGWTFYLTNLKSFLEGGIDLRNKNEELKNMVNA